MSKPCARRRGSSFGHPARSRTRERAARICRWHCDLTLRLHPYAHAPLLATHDACAEKTDLLRQAKAEADREVAQYRASLESEYQRMLAQGSTDAGTTLERLNSETESTIRGMKSKVDEKKGQVSKLLIDYIKKV